VTSEDDYLRKLHVDLIVDRFGFDDWRDLAERSPKEFIVDIVQTSVDNGTVLGSAPGLTGQSKETWFKIKKKEFCFLYHEHSESELSSTKMIL